MEVTTIQKFVHRSPRKLRLVADSIRAIHPVKAVELLRFTSKYAASDLAKAVSTVLGNAKQVGLDLENLRFVRIEINEGPRMKRFRAGARGRVKPYKRRLSHIRIVLTDEVEKIKTEKENLTSKKEVVSDSTDKSKSVKRGKSESLK